MSPELSYFNKCPENIIAFFIPLLEIEVVEFQLS